MAIQIEKITLREIAMPLVHFFETSFGRTTHRRIILVEVVSQGVSGWGEVTCGENPFYNEEWTDAAWMIVRDYVAPRVLHIPFESAAEVAGRSATHSRPLHGSRRSGSRGVGSGSAAEESASVGTHRRRLVQGDRLRSFDRHSEHRAAVARDHREGSRRRLPAHQDQDQARLGYRRGARGPHKRSPRFA